MSKSNTKELKKSIIIALTLILTLLLAGCSSTEIVETTNKTETIEIDDTDRYKQIIENSILNIDTFEFELNYRKYKDNATYDGRNYIGYLKRNESNSAYDFNIDLDSLIYSEIGENKDTIKNEDRDNDLSFLMFSNYNIDKITPITAGYEVNASMHKSDKNYKATYTVIYENKAISNIIGNIDCADESYSINLKTVANVSDAVISITEFIVIDGDMTNKVVGDTYERSVLSTGAVYNNEKNGLAILKGLEGKQLIIDFTITGVDESTGEQINSIILCAGEHQEVSFEYGANKLILYIEYKINE